MKINECVGCKDFPCLDVNHESYQVPIVVLDPQQVKIIMISEATPEDPADYYYAQGEPLFQQTTLLAFQDAGAAVSSFQEILDLGVYLTSAVKCTKIGYGIKAGTINECSFILEKELDQFPNVQVFLLMGDVAIKAVNYISRRAGQGRVIPAGSTYKLRGQDYNFRGKRAFPSYLQAGPSFFIEKSKRKAIAEDIHAALNLVK
jgi:uracil-DNA glycosylase